MRSALPKSAALAVAVLLGWLGLAPAARAHCDTTQGPVVASARIALERGDLTPVLKWLKPEHEAEARAALAQALEVRVLGPAARQLADRYFFETLVRLHRAGEGAPYDGLKDEAPEAVIQATDDALASGGIDELVKKVGDAAADGVRARFTRARAARALADHSVEEGRRYVAAYVDLTHYVERLYGVATATESHGATAEAPAHEHR